MNFPEPELLKIDDMSNGEHFNDSGCGDEMDNKSIVRNFVNVCASSNFKPDLLSRPHRFVEIHGTDRHQQLMHQ